MAYSFVQNLIPSTGSVVMYQFKELLKTVGYTILSSSDGTTYNSTGDQISSGSSGAGGMANNSAWFRAQMPIVDGVRREFTFQRGTGADTAWRVKYSFSSGFTGGSPGATQTPSAADEVILTGGGTDAVPSFGAVFTTNGTYKTNIVAGNADEYYTWCILNVANANLTVTTGSIFLERMLENTYPKADPDPYVMVFTSTNPTTSNLSGATTVIKGWMAKGTANQAFVSIPPQQYTDGSLVAIGNLGTNTLTGKEDPLPMLYLRRAGVGTPSGLKGIGRMLKWKGLLHGVSSSMSVAKAISIDSNNDHIVIGDLIAPYGGAIPIT